MEPYEIKGFFLGQAFGIGYIQPAFEVAGYAGYPQRIAYILAGSPARHRVEHRLRLEEKQQVADQVAGAIARILAVSVVARVLVMVKARQPWHGAAGCGACGKAAYLGWR